MSIMDQNTNLKIARIPERKKKKRIAGGLTKEFSRISAIKRIKMITSKTLKSIWKRVEISE